MKPTHGAVVTWVDQFYTPGPQSSGDSLGEVIGQTIGFITGENSKAIEISAEYFAHADNVRHVISIPKCAVRKIKRFKI